MDHVLSRTHRDAACAPRVGARRHTHRLLFRWRRRQLAIADRHPFCRPLGDSGTLTEAAQSGDLGAFLSAVTAAGLQQKLQEAGQFTVFAPNKAAFGAVSLDQLGQGRTLKDVVGYHIVPGQNIQLSAVQSGDSFVTDEGAPLTITFDGSTTLVNDATVVAAYAGTDWTLYVIDRVLFPPAASPAP